jgi:membrane-associated phospholipid phosphatase
MKIRYKLILLAITLPCVVFGQGDSLRVRSDAFRLADGVVYTFSSPARWTGKDVLVLGGLIAGTTALTYMDHPVRDFWQRHDNRFMDGVERVGYHYGKPYTAFGFTTGVYLAGVIFKNQWAKETGLVLGTTLFTSGFLMGVLKDVAGRARPAEGIDHMEFKPFNQAPAYHAFPSGHSAVAFGISLVMAKRIDNLPVKILFYSLAGTTAVSRMYSDSHWVSDIAFGGMLAWFCADTALMRMQANRFRTSFRAKNKLVWKVFPYPGGLTARASVL